MTISSVVLRRHGSWHHLTFRQAHQRLEEINQEHIEIAEALLKNDGESAAELTKHHFNLTQEAHLKILLGDGYPTHRAVNQG